MQIEKITNDKGYQNQTKNFELFDNYKKVLEILKR